MSGHIRSYTQPAEGFLVGPPDAPDEVVDVKEYNRAMEALENADAAYEALKLVVSRYARHDELCHALDRESLATHERVCTCGLEDALATVHMGK